MVWFSATSAFAASVPGHVEAWGHNGFGQVTPPPGLDGVVAVAGGSAHSLALRSDGTVVAWGSNSEGQAVIPPGLSNVRAIAAGGHNVALRSNGTLVVWGSNSAAVTNVPVGLNGVAAIATGISAGNPYTLALRSNGTVVAWGINSATNVPAGLSGVVGIAAGLSHCLALKNDGTVIGWADNFAGAATPPPGLAGVVAVRAGQFCSLALKADGTVVKWGSFADVPGGLDGVVDVQFGAQHALALRSNGVAVAWGSGAFGVDTVPAGLTGVSAVSAGVNHNLVVTARPLILSMSPPVIGNAGDRVMFSVGASGPPLSYQWRRNGADLAGATNASLTLGDVQAADAGAYTVLVSNPYGSVLSPSTSLSFRPPVINAHPQPATRYRGESATFNVAASGLVPLSYQWRKAGANLSGATMATLILTNVGTTNAAGSYQVIVTDAVGSSTASVEATLTVIDPTLPNSVTLIPVADTSIYTSGSNPQGLQSILAGTRNNGIIDRGLLRFNLSSIPSAAMIHSADLRLTVTKVPRSPANSNFSLYRMYKLWGLDATWTNATAGAPWSAAGGWSGVDYSGSSSATRFVTGGGVYDFGPSSAMAADVQAWLANPGTNFGWMLKTESEGSPRSARHFGSSESAQPPQLLLQYAFPAPPARLTDVVAQTDKLMFRFDGAAGWFYRIECRDNLESGAWTTVTNVAAGSARSIAISVPATASRRFYRVLAE